jgi:hypothetical protein
VWAYVRLCELVIFVFVPVIIEEDSISEAGEEMKCIFSSIPEKVNNP